MKAELSSFKRPGVDFNEPSHVAEPIELTRKKRTRRSVPMSKQVRQDMVDRHRANALARAEALLQNAQELYIVINRGSLFDIENRCILDRIIGYDGSLDRAAKSLKISRNTIDARLKLLEGRT